MPFHLSERVRQQMLTAAFFQSIHCEITVVSVLLTKLSFVRDNSVKHAASPALRDCFSTRKRSFSHLLVLFEHHTPVASVCVCVCARTRFTRWMHAQCQVHGREKVHSSLSSFDEKWFCSKQGVTEVISLQASNSPYFPYFPLPVTPAFRLRPFAFRFPRAVRVI